MAEPGGEDEVTCFDCGGPHVAPSEGGDIEWCVDWTREQLQAKAEVTRGEVKNLHDRAVKAETALAAALTRAEDAEARERGCTVAARILSGQVEQAEAACERVFSILSAVGCDGDGYSEHPGIGPAMQAAALINGHEAALAAARREGVEYGAREGAAQAYTHVGVLECADKRGRINAAVDSLVADVLRDCPYPEPDTAPSCDCGGPHYSSEGVLLYSHKPQCVIWAKRKPSAPPGDTTVRELVLRPPGKVWTDGDLTADEAQAVIDGLPRQGHPPRRLGPLMTADDAIELVTGWVTGETLASIYEADSHGLARDLRDRWAKHKAGGDES